MSYVALYRKFRPQTFAQVKGQEAVVRTLQNQIKNNRIGHAYLFTGTRGTGKTSVAKIFAKAVNCLNPHDGEPCNECENCRAITNGNFIDVAEIDAASNTGVEDIRRVIEEIRYTPVYGRFKVYIIDEVHMLSPSASNAFLKTLEEPPEYVIFILATTDPHKLPVTILSRCQRYDFRRITSDEIAENINELLKTEEVEAEEKAVRYVAQAGDGSMRDALSLLDKAIAFTLGEKLTYEAALKALGTVDSEVFSNIFRYVAAGDAFGAVSVFDEAVRSGKAIGQFINDFIWYLRNLMLIGISGGKESEILGISDDSLKILEEDAKFADTTTVVRYIEELSSLANSLKMQSMKQAACEISLIKLARPQMQTDMSALFDRVRQLEEGGVCQKGASLQATEADTERSCAKETQEGPVTSEAEPVYEHSKESKEVEGLSDKGQAAEQGKFDENAKAAPADLVRASWKNVVEGCNLFLNKGHLAQAEVEPMGEDAIRITIQDNIGFHLIDEWKEGLKELIKNTTGCDISLSVVLGNVEVPTLKGLPPVKTQMAAEAMPAFESEYEPDYNEQRIEQLLKENVMMNIEEEA